MGASNNTPAKTSRQKSHRFHLAFKDREYFTDNLALLLKAAVPINDALGSLSSSTHNTGMKRAIEGMRVDIEAGYGLADALERSGLVSGQTLALVRLGQNSGHLVENLQLAAKQEEKRHLFRAKVQSALIYPVFVLTITLVVGLGVAWFLLPKLAVTFTQLKVKMPLITRLMIGFGVFLKDWGIIAVPAFFVVLAVMGYILFGLPRTKAAGQRLLFAIPGVGRLMREVEIAQFGYLLGTLLDAGLPVTQAMHLLVDASSAQQYQVFYSYFVTSLGDGYSFQESLTRYKKSERLLPAAVVQMVIAGERSGSLPDVLMTIGRTYEEKADITTNNLEAVIEPILLIIVAVGVLLVAVGVILPIYSLVGGIN